MQTIIRALIPIAILMLVGCKEREIDPAVRAFEKEFAAEAVLVRTCPGDPTLASGETSIATKVYRFRNELWFRDRGTLRRVDAKPENVCEIVSGVRDPPEGGESRSSWPYPLAAIIALVGRLFGR